MVPSVWMGGDDNLERASSARELQPDHLTRMRCDIIWPGGEPRNIEYTPVMDFQSSNSILHAERNCLFHTHT